MKTNNYSKTIVVRNIILISVLCLVMSGCIGGCFVISDIKFTVSLIKNATIPGTPNSIYLGREVQLAKVCGQFDTDKIREQLISGIQKLPVGSNILVRLVDRIKIKNLWLEKITITTTEGNFDGIESISLKIRIGTEERIGTGEIDLGQGKFNDDKTSIIFEKDPKVDIYPYIKDLDNGGCVEGTMSLKGYTNQKDIRFDVTSNMLMKISL